MIGKHGCWCSQATGGRSSSRGVVSNAGQGLGGAIVSLRGLALVAIILVAAGVLAWAVAAGEETGPGLRFSHRVHVIGLEAPCEMCHAGAPTWVDVSETRTPSMDECSVCHDVEDEELCSQCHAGVPGRVARTKPAIVFSHEKHVKEESAPCESCHAGVELAEVAGVPHLPDMDICLGCHDGAAAPASCPTCHMNPSDLGPETHREGWLSRHGELVRSGDEGCRACHDDASCQECHYEAELVEDEAPGSPPAPKREMGSGFGKGLVLEANHGLDYRYTHGLDAQRKESDCHLCHDQNTFCVACHRAGTDAGDKPLWHGGDGWGAITGGVGTGGGRHADLARRDMERCAACHDLVSEDPICLLCHRDQTPGRGNDPRTHGYGYGDDLGRGPWHDDYAYLCYVCHTRGARRGDGFCGYCH